MDRDWIKTTDICTALSMSKIALKALQSELKEGYHYRITTPKSAKRRTYQWHLKRMDEYLNKPLENR
ncbi:MAG: hypothetical protein HC773_05605 [Scytonema sp. CRU_2_7]|nr:hypothetical protein [Scytonema sp. CRU_2_7]